MHLMAMRVVMLGSSATEPAGGEERPLNVDERLKLDVRVSGRKPANGAPMRFPAKAGPGPDPGWGPARRQENASHQTSGAPFRCNRNGKGPRPP